MNKQQSLLGHRRRNLPELEISDALLDNIVEQVVEPGIWVGVEGVRPTAERILHGHIKAAVAKNRLDFSREIEQKRARVTWLEKWLGNLRDTWCHIKTADLEGWFSGYLWVLLVASVVIVLGDAILFPTTFYQLFGLSLWAGVCFSITFVVAPYILNGMLYKNLDENSRKRFRKTLMFIWVIAFALFTVSFYGAVALDRAATQSNATGFLPSLADQTTGSSLDSWLAALYFVSLVSLWFLVCCTSTALVIMHAHYRQAKTRSAEYGSEIDQAELELEKETQTLTEKEQVQQWIEGLTESALGRLDAKLMTALINRKENVMRTICASMAVSEVQPKKLGRASKRMSRDGKSSSTTSPVLRTLAMLIPLSLGIWLGPKPLSAAEPVQVVLIQDLGRKSQALEDDYQGFGRVLQALPEGAKFEILGSDGIRYAHGSIVGEYRREVQKSRYALAMTGMMLYKKIKESPQEVRDYARVLGETLPRLTTSTTLIIQGCPLYCVDSVSWDERIPNLAWVWNDVSPFGPKAIPPAPVPFRVAIIYDSYDFVTPIHKAALNHWWGNLFSRLNGRLAVFSTGIEDAVELLRNPEAGQVKSDSFIQSVSDQERNGDLTLTPVSKMSIQKK